MYTKKELNKKRVIIRDALERYYRKKYDGRPLIKAYQQVCEVFRSLGGNPKTPVYCDPKSWTNPEAWSRASQCKNPIIGIDEDFNLIRARHKKVCRLIIK